MSASNVLLIVILLAIFSYFVASRRTSARAAQGIKFHSLPSYYGFYVALWCGLPALMLFAVWSAAETHIIKALTLDFYGTMVKGLDADAMSLAWIDISNVARGTAAAGKHSPEIHAAAERITGLRNLGNMMLGAALLALAAGGVAFAWRRISPEMRARQSVERTFDAILIFSSTVAILTTLGIVLSLLFEASRFFYAVSPLDFIFGSKWTPNPFETDPEAVKNDFGFIPLLTGTLLITAVAMFVAVPVGLFAAIYLTDYAPARVRNLAKPTLEVLAGIPTVVYGVFALLTVAPAIADSMNWLLRTLGMLPENWSVPTQSALAAGLVMGIMIVPFVSSLIDDVINAVPRSLRDGSAGLGATKSETMRQVILPAALPGIVAAVMLAISKAVGETMIVVMAAGTLAKLTVNPLEAVTTVTVQIEKALTGDQPFDSPATLAAFALGLVLFIVTLSLNVYALRIVNKYRERYD